MLIGGLEGVQIHPLDTKPIGKIERNTNTTVDLLINSALSNSIFGYSQRKTPTLQPQSDNIVMSNEEAKSFFGITDEDIKRARPFTA